MRLPSPRPRGTHRARSTCREWQEVEDRRRFIPGQSEQVHVLPIVLQDENLVSVTCQGYLPPPERLVTGTEVPERRRTNSASGTQNAVETDASMPGNIPLSSGIVMCSDLSFSIVMSQQTACGQKPDQRLLQHSVDITCNSLRHHRSPCSHTI